jgi:hypothetical protein
LEICTGYSKEQLHDVLQFISHAEKDWNRKISRSPLGQALQDPSGDVKIDFVNPESEVHLHTRLPLNNTLFVS